MYNHLRNLKSFAKTCMFLSIKGKSKNINTARIKNIQTKVFNFDTDYPFNSIGLGEVAEMNYIISSKAKQPNSLKNIANELQQDLLNVQFVITYNGNSWDLPLLQNNFSKVNRPFNYKTSKHYNNDVVLFIDLFDIVNSELKSIMYEECDDVNNFNLRLETVYNYVNKDYVNALGLDITLDKASTLDMMIRVFIAIIERYNINVYNYVTSFINLPNYILTIENDAERIITKKGKYANLPLNKLLEDKSAKKWLNGQHLLKNLTLDITLQTATNE